MKKNLYLLFLFIAVVSLFTACVKDTDFNQTDDIVVAPTLELDFLFFNVDSESFSDLGVNNLVITDTTEFSFLNDDIAVDNLIRADFYFRNTNSFPVQFTTQYQFLDENNDLHYEILIPVNDGTLNNPVITEYSEIIEGDGILSLTMAEKVVINIVASSSVDNLEGNLNLQSKTTYYLRVEQ